MRKIIDGEVWDTEKATLLAEYWNDLPVNDFGYVIEQLYITKSNNRFFLFCEGGAQTKYAKWNDNSSCSGSIIIPLSRDEAYKWLEDQNEIEVIEEQFGHIKEA